MAQEISIPGSGDPVLLPSNQTFYFRLATPCTVCFGPSNPSGAFPDLANQSFSNWGAQSPNYPIPANATAYIQFNTSALGTPCSPSGLAAAPRIIHIGQGVRGHVDGSLGEGDKPAKKKKDKDKKKSKAKQGGKKHPGKHKAKKSGKSGAKKSPKKAGKKAAKKATKKKSAKKAAKSRTAGKGRRR